MGVEMIKDRFGEDQLVLSNEDFYNDDIMGDKFANYAIMKIIKSNGDKSALVAKLASKKNSKIYLLKQLSNNLNQDQINKEFQILNKLSHPNITRYFKLFVDNGNVYIVKEYVDNGGLDKLIDAYKSIEKPIDANTLWNIFMQCMAGL
jgi:serine/threonine protein kinase